MKKSLPWLSSWYLPPAKYEFLRFEAEATDDVIHRIKSLSAQIYPDLPPVKYEFLNSRFENLYLAETKLQTLVFIFCSLSIILTFSGIFGLAAFVTQQKTKELAIRKILGSSVLNIIGIMSRNFIILALISFLITIPVSWFVVDWWLSNFAYHIQIAPGLYLLSITIILIIVIGSSSYSILKAAYSDPVNSLRTE